MADDVIKLVTRAERLRVDVQSEREAAQAEAIAMLERALVMVKERSCAGLAIALVLEDGHYGFFIPLQTVDMSRLIGAAASMQHALIASTED